MLRQTYEGRETDTSIELQMQFQFIALEDKVDRTESTFSGNGKMTQERFEENMTIADKVSRQWL